MGRSLQVNPLFQIYMYICCPSFFLLRVFFWLIGNASNMLVFVRPLFVPKLSVQLAVKSLKAVAVLDNIGNLCNRISSIFSDS